MGDALRGADPEAALERAAVRVGLRRRPEAASPGIYSVVVELSVVVAADGARLEVWLALVVGRPVGHRGLGGDAVGVVVVSYTTPQYTQRSGESGPCAACPVSH